MTDREPDPSVRGARGRRLRRAGIVAVALSALLLAGCGLPSDGAARPIPATAVPYGLLGPAATATTTAPTPEGKRSEQPRTYLLGSDQLLQPVPAAVDLSQLVTSRQELTALFALLAAGPTESQRAQGLSTALTPGVRIELLSVHDRIADVAVDAGLKDPSADRLPLAIGQLVLTATSVEGIDAVQLLRDGAPVEVPLPGGALTAAPLNRFDYRALLHRPTVSPTPEPTSADAAATADRSTSTPAKS